MLLGFDDTKLVVKSLLRLKISLRGNIGNGLFHPEMLKKCKSRSRSMVVWMMVRYGWVGGGQNGVVWGVVGSSMDDDVDDGMDGL